MYAQHESILGVEGSSELGLPASTGDESPHGLYIQQSSKADAFAMVGDLQDNGNASAGTRSAKGETEFCTPPASVGRGFDEKPSSRTGSASFPTNISAPIGLLLGTENVSDLPQAFRFPAACPLTPIPSTSPITGINSGTLSQTQPSSPEFSLAMLEETIASTEFNAQLHAARAVADIRANAADACFDAAKRGPHPDELDSLIAAQIGIEIRKDARRRTAPIGMRTGARNFSRKKGQAAKRPASGCLSQAVHLPEYQLPPTVGCGTHNVPARTRNTRAAGVGSSGFPDSGPGTTSAALHQQQRHERCESKAQHGTLPRPTKPTRAKGQKSNGGLDGKVEKTFKCDLCPKVFERRYNLKVHMRKSSALRGSSVLKSPTCVALVF